MAGSTLASAPDLEVAAGWRPGASAVPARARRALRTPGGLVGLALTLSFLLVASLADRLAPLDPFAPVAGPLQPPSLAHPLGTDDLGRDLLAGIVHGARTSLLVMLGAALLAAGVGMAVGLIAGYRGGMVDDVLSRLTEFAQGLPRFFLAVVAVALVGQRLEAVVLVLGLTSWPWIARVSRAQTLSLRSREFVDAARALGASTPRIVLRQILPHALPAIVVVASLNAASVILLEAGLSFLGLGDPARMSWGYLANNAQKFLRVAWWMAAFPGAAIALTVLDLNQLGDAVTDLLDPRG